MKVDINNHPCFNEDAKGTCGRVHLPVAPRCNIQCNYCNRKYDCVNESRPGVTSSVLSPRQALAYLDSVMERNPEIKVVGIAGPGDPMANAEETLETFRLVRDKYPEMVLCLSTNGLNLADHIGALVELEVSHVTITINALDPAIGEKIYSRVRYGKRVRRPEEGVPILIAKQLEGVRLLKENGLIVKINTIILPGVNDHHIPAIAEKVAEMKADLLNCIPLYPTKGTRFADLKQPSCSETESVRSKAGEFLPQMRHCTRCRADAVGLLGKKMGDEDFDLLKKFEEMEIAAEPVPVDSAGERPYVAVASMEGALVNQHLGEAVTLSIYECADGDVRLVEERRAPKPGGGAERWRELGRILHDCRTLAVNGIGETPKAELTAAGMEIVVVEGLVQEVVGAVFAGQDLKHLIKRSKAACASCSGGGGGCAA